MITVNGHKIDAFSFPGGERHVNVAKIPEADRYIVEARILNSDDLMDTMLTCDALKRVNGAPLTLLIPYFPYGRQDRVCASGDPLSLEVVCKMLEGLGLHEIVTLDPHSPLPDNITQLTNQHFVNTVYMHLTPDFLICPDAGARKKYDFFSRMPTVFCGKKRDPKTGKLSGFEIVDMTIAPERGDVGLVVDDICDGGGTFLGLADLFPQKLCLAVTHGIFSKGLDPLFQKYSQIFTTTSRRNPDKRNPPKRANFHVIPWINAWPGFSK